MNNYKNKIAIVITMILVGFAANINAWPRVDFPPQASAKQKMADEIFVNGMPLKITNFKTRLSVEQVLQYYRNKWVGAFSESKQEQWQQISHLKKNYFITVQVKEADIIDNGFETFGRLNISHLDEKARKPSKVFPMFLGSQIVNDVETVDKDKRGRTLLFLNHRTLDENVTYYKEHYAKNNWNQVMAQKIGDAGFVYTFKKKKNEVTINIQAIGNNSSSILVNEVIRTTWFN